MSEDEKPKKRVGSWWKYLAYVAKKGTLSSIGVSLLLTFCFIGALLIAGVLTSIWEIIRNPVIASVVGTVIRLFLFCMIGLGSLIAVALLCQKSLTSAIALNPVLPPTRQNTTSLPAQDVLVRASVEPTEEAGKTLLRATVADGETPAGELLRPL